MDANEKILKSIKLFSDNFSQEFLKELCLQFKEMTFAPEELISEVCFFNSNNNYI